MSVFRVGSNKSSVNNFPTLRPTLDLDFANSKTLDPRITFTRASGGSYVGADGLIKYAGVNEPRFDHDPVTGESLGLLIEESRQNLLLRSEEFDIGWSTSGLFVNKNQQYSPDGNSNSYLLITSNNITLANAGLTRTISKSASVTTYTLSIFAKAFSFNRITLLSYESGNLGNRAALDVNLSTGKFEIFPTASGTFSEASGGVIPYPNNWYRVFLTFKSGTEVNLVSRFNSRDSTSTVGDGTSGIYIWGAQLEQGNFPTSYIPTQGSTRTRAADNASITGKNFSDFYRQDEGTFIAKARSYNLTQSTFPYFLRVDDGTNNNNIGLAYIVTSLGAINVRTNGEGVVEMYIPINTNPRTGSLAYKLNDVASSFNGGTIFTDTSASIPSLNKMQIGDIGTALNTLYNLNGYISQLTYYPKRLPNEQLIALTK